MIIMSMYLFIDKSNNDWWLKTVDDDFHLNQQEIVYKNLNNLHNYFRKLINELKEQVVKLNEDNQVLELRLERSYQRGDYDPRVNDSHV